MDRGRSRHGQRHAGRARHAGERRRRRAGRRPAAARRSRSASTSRSTSRSASSARPIATCPATSSTSSGTASASFRSGGSTRTPKGLILLTNDGDIVNTILRAENEHEKEYVVAVDRPLTPAFLAGMAAGVPILDTVTNPVQGHAGRQEHLPHRADAGPEPPDPPHVRALRLHGARPAARAHHARAASATCRSASGAT